MNNTISNAAIVRAKATKRYGELHRDSLILLLAQIDDLRDPAIIARIVNPLLTTAQALVESHKRFWELIKIIKAQGLAVAETEQDMTDNTSSDEARRIMEQVLGQISFIQLARGIEALDPLLFDEVVREVVNHTGGAGQLRALQRALRGVNLER